MSHPLAPLFNKITVDFLSFAGVVASIHDYEQRFLISYDLPCSRNDNSLNIRVKIINYYNCTMLDSRVTFKHSGSNTNVYRSIPFVHRFSVNVLYIFFSFFYFKLFSLLIIINIIRLLLLFVFFCCCCLVVSGVSNI